VWNGRNRQVLFSGSGGECNRGLNVLRLQGRKILQNLIGRIAVSQAGQDCPQSYARAFEDSLSPAYRWVADDSVFIVLQIASWAAQWIASLLSVHFITPDRVCVDAIYLAAVKLRVPSGEWREKSGFEPGFFLLAFSQNPSEALTTVLIAYRR
jgi:hypothetical protein